MVTSSIFLLASWTIINHFSKIIIAKMPSLSSFDFFLPTSKNFGRRIFNAILAKNLPGLPWVLQNLKRWKETRVGAQVGQ